MRGSGRRRAACERGKPETRVRWAEGRRGGRRGPTGHREGKHRQWRSRRGRGRTFGGGRRGKRGRNGREDDKRRVGGGRIPRWCRSDSQLSHRSKGERCRRGHGGGSGGRRRGWQTGTGRWQRGSAGCGSRKRRWPGGPAGSSRIGKGTPPPRMWKGGRRQGKGPGRRARGQGRIGGSGAGGTSEGQGRRRGHRGGPAPVRSRRRQTGTRSPCRRGSMRRRRCGGDPGWSRGGQRRT